jgi:Fic family protein
LRRTAQQTNIPLVGVDGVALNFGTPPEVQALLSSLDRRLGTEAQLFRDHLPSAESRERFLLRSLFEESITSSQIEGAVTTREVARAMLAENRPPQTKHERMIANNYAAIRYIRASAQEPLTEESLLEIHRIITAGTLENPDQEGRFRTESDAPVTLQDAEGAIVYTPPPPAELPARIRTLCDFANDRSEGAAFIHPILRSILLHFWLAYDHPFVDGNGRTARALFYRAMLHAGYPLVEHVSISEVILRHTGAYYEAFLHTETDDNDATYFVINQLEMLDEAIDQLYRHLEAKQKEFGEHAHRLAALPGLNHRQIALMLHGIKTPGALYLAATHAGFHQVSVLTAQRDLAELVSLGLLLAGPKRDKANTYLVPADLADRLQSAARLAASPRLRGRPKKIRS